MSYGNAQGDYYEEVEVTSDQMSIDYNFAESHVKAPSNYVAWTGKRKPFARVMNEGTQESDNLRLSSYADAIDFKEVGKRILAACKKKGANKNRGNHQVNVLFSGGENHVRNEKEVNEDFGCTMPGTNEGTDDWLETALILSEITTKVNVSWTNDSAMTPSDTFRMERFSRRVHPKNCLEGMTAAAIRLFPNPGAIKPHSDKKNCTKFREVIIFSQIVHIKEEIWRVSLIGYMRKSCDDSLIRREACKEVSLNTRKYLASLPSHLNQCASVAQHRDFYGQMGELGLGLIMSCDNLNDSEEAMTVEAAALFNRPHLDKGMSYISAVSTAILKIYANNPHMNYQDVFLMALPVGQISGIFTYCSVLTQLAYTKNIDCSRPLRVLDVIIDKMIEYAGSYAGGKFPRTQNAWQTGPPATDRTLSDVKLIARMCRMSSENPPAGTTYKAFCSEMHAKYTSILMKVYGVGDFGSQALLQVLTQVGVLKPAGMLHNAHFAVSTSTLKADKKNGPAPNPAMINYLYYTKGETSEGGPKSATDKARRVMDSVIPHLQLYEPNITQAVVEQVNCESYRKKCVADFYFPLASNLFYPVAAERTDGPLIWEMTPRYNPEKEATEVHSKVRSPAEPRQGNDTPTMCTRRLKVDDRKFLYCRIPWEEIRKHPGLASEIRQRFFGSKSTSPQDVYTWIQGEPTLGRLAKKFARNPRPMKESMMKLCKPCQQVPSLVPSMARSSSGSFFSISEPERNVSMQDLSEQASKKRPADDSNQLVETVPEAVPVTAKGLVITIGQINHYRFPTNQSAEVVAGWLPESLTTNRKLVQVKKDKHRLSPIHAELKRCLYMGMPESKMPLQMRKGSIQQVLCTFETHDIPRATQNTYYMMHFAANNGSDFYTCGLCAVVDSIATNLGAISAGKKDTMGLKNWLFQSDSQSRLHFYQCLMLLGGKPAYFKRLASKLGHIQRKKNSASPKHKWSLVEVMDPNSAVGCIFYLALDHEKSQSSIIMSVGNIDPSDSKRQGSRPLCFDPIKWKDYGAMHVGSPAAGSNPGNRRHARRLRRKTVSDSDEGKREKGMAKDEAVEGAQYLFDTDPCFRDAVESGVL